MSHVIIITESSPPPPTDTGAAHAGHDSAFDYRFEFAPSHHLAENVVNKRIAKLRKKLSELAAEVTAPIEPTES